MDERRQRIWTTAVIVVGIIVLLIHAAADAEPTVVGTWGDRDGARCLAPDGSALWIGTSGSGMIRSDPSGTTTYDSTDGLPGNGATDCTDHDGTVWVATENGLAWFDRVEDRFVTVHRGRFLALASAADTLVAARDDGRLLIRTGLITRRARVEFVPTSVAVDDRGGIAAAGLSGDLIDMRDGRSFRLGVPVLGLAFDGDALAVRSAAGSYTREPGGELIARAGSDDGADPVSAALGLPAWAAGITKAPLRDWVETDRARALATDGGVYLLAANGTWRRLELGGLPCGPRITSLAVFDGAVWAGGFQNGLCVNDGGVWTQYRGAALGGSDMVNDLAADGEHLYVATGGGLVIVDRDRTPTALPGSPRYKDERYDGPWHDAVNGVTVDARTGDVWVTDYAAVHRITAGGWEHYDYRRGVYADGLTHVAADGGIVAVGTGKSGVHLAESPDWAKERGWFWTEDDQRGLPGNWVMDLAFDRAGDLWVATCTDGVGRRTGTRWRTYDETDGLIDDYALAVREVDGRMWVGTLSGLSIIDGETVVNLDESDGLSGREVHDILPVGNRVYLATDAGVTILAP